MILTIFVITVPGAACTTPTPTPTPTPAPAPGWYDCGWSNRQSITIDSTKVVGTQSNFPVLISLASDSDLSAKAQASGNDILFTLSDGTTKLSHQVESFKSSTGALVAWVKVPSLSSSSNTVLYMYYGNPGAANQQNAANVWSNGYKDVWHLDEGGTGPRSDSTGSGSNLNTRNYKGNEGTTGQIGGADSLDGTSKYLESASNVGITGSAARTITFWAKLANTNRNGMVGWGANAMESEFEAAVRANSYFLWGYGGGNDWAYIATPLTGSWNYYAITYDGTTARWYLNGTQIGSGFEHDYTTADSHVFVGYEYDSGQSSITYMNGTMDEVHVDTAIRSAKWIQTEFNNQNSPSTFSSLQAVEKVGDHSTCRIPTPPVAAFSASPISGKAPLTVTFTDQSTNTPTSWSWDFGDGATSNLQNPVHTYTAAGTYTVKLTASNGDGSNTLVKSTYITVNMATPPVAGFTADVTTGKAPLTVTFTDQSTNTPTSWSWDFGDGATSNLQNPVHTYTAAGTYTVKLTASNGDGSNTLVKATYITVNMATPPVAGFTADVTTGKAPLTVTFTDQSTNTPTSWSWDFGDGATSTLQSPVHTYTAAGTYTVKLTASNGDGSNTLVKSTYITVNMATPPVAGFTADVTTGKAPLTVTFTDQSTNTPTSWSWDFGDGATSNLQNPVHTYSAGTYTVKLTASNGDGSNTLVKAIYITVNMATPPVAGFTADVTTGKAPLTVTFTDQSTNTPTSWSWDFGDGATSTLQSPSHTYSAGTYTVTLTASNGDGSDTLGKADYITVSMDCGDSYSLVTGSGETAGCVAVRNDWTVNEATDEHLNTLSVAYTLADAYCLRSADAAIGGAVSFHPSQDFDASTCIKSYTFSIPMGDTGDVSYLYVTVHGVVQKVTGRTTSADMDVVSPDNPIYYIMQF